jgi:hypothetical protein
MKRAGPQSFFFVLAFTAALTIACGSSSPKPNPILGCPPFAIGPNTTGTLESISICPSSADARNAFDGQVPFDAIGTYNTAPQQVTPLDARAGWGACFENQPTTAVTVSSKGVAQCQPGASGTYTIYASDFPQQNGGCDAIAACGGGCVVSGYAKLTCP